MKPLFDLHVHTISSGHAYSTLKENIEAARERDLAALGIADHAPAMPGAPHPFYFANLRVVRESILGVRICKGIEANILDFGGTIDVEDGMARKLDFVIASLHPPCIVPGTEEENTRALIEVMKNPWVKIIGHPDDDRYPLDYEALVSGAKREKVALEINNSSFCPGSGRRNARKNASLLLNLCRRKKVPVLLGSDAHIWYDVGEFSLCLELLGELDFPPELVLNYTMEGLEFVLNPGKNLPEKGEKNPSGKIGQSGK